MGKNRKKKTSKKANINSTSTLTLKNRRKQSNKKSNINSRDAQAEGVVIPSIFIPQQPTPDNGWERELLPRTLQQNGKQRCNIIYNTMYNQYELKEGYSLTFALRIIVNYIVLWFEKNSLRISNMMTTIKCYKKRAELNFIDLPSIIIVFEIFPYLESRREWTSLLSLNKRVCRCLRDYEDTFFLWPEKCELSTGPYSHLGDPQWSPSGKQVACHDTTKIHIFDQRLGLVNKWEAHRNWSIHSLKYFPNGKALVSSGSDGHVKIWNCDVNFKCIHDWTHILQKDDDGCNNSELAVSPGSKFIAVLQSELICLIDVNNGSIRRSINLNMGCICNVIFSVDGLSVIFGGDEDDFQNGVIKVWKIENAKEDAIVSLKSGNGNSVEALAVSPNGFLLISASNDGNLKLWDYTSDGNLQYIRSLKGHPGYLSSVSFTPCGMFVAAGSGEDFSGDLRFWRIGDGTCSYAIETNGTVNAIKYSPNGSRCLVQDDNLIFVKSLDPTGTENVDKDKIEPHIRNGPLMVDFSFPSNLESRALHW